MWIATPIDRPDIRGSDADVYQPESVDVLRLDADVGGPGPRSLHCVGSSR